MHDMDLEKIGYLARSSMLLKTERFISLLLFHIVYTVYR